MKKILLMAVAALVFVACNENGPTPADQKCAKVVSSEAVDLIGKDMATVEQTLTAAGYVKVEAQKVQAAPARVRALVEAAEDQSVAYVYGLPANVDKMTEAEFDECMQKALKDGKTIAIAQVKNAEGKMASMQTIMYLKLQPGANKLFIDISNSLFSKIPEGAIQKQPTKFPLAMWYGMVAVGAEEEPTQADDHAAYIAKISANTEVSAQEMAQVAESQQSGWVYQAMWVNPNEETKKDIEEELGTAIVYGMFGVGNLVAMQGGE